MEMEEQSEVCPCRVGRKKEREEEEKRLLLNRLNRIEGQIRGIKGMLEEDAYCTDVLTQVSAATSALNSFGRVLLEEHIRTCVTRDIQAGKEETVEELMTILKKMMK